MKKFIYSLLAACAAFIPLVASAERPIPGDWKVFNTFDNYFKETIVTSDRVYMLALGQMLYPSEFPWDIVHGHLFVLDRKTGEISGYNGSNYLGGNEILDIAYNPSKGYLLIIYDDYSIDILYDDDTVFAVPAVSSPTLSVSKNVNSVTFDPEGNRAYLATDFGYISIDDNAYAIGDVKVYNRPVNAIARVGDHLVLGASDGLFTSPLDDRHTTFSSFTPVDGYASNVKFVLPLDANRFSIIEDKDITLGTFAADGSLTMELKSTESPAYYADNKDGYFLRRNGCAFQLDRQGELTPVYTDTTPYGNTECGSWDMKDFYFPAPRKGIARQTYNGDYTWSEDEILVPDAPQSFGVMYIAASPEYGVFTGSDTYSRLYPWFYMNYTALLSAYKNGHWTQYGRPAFAHDPLQNYLRDTRGPVFDPLDSDRIWVGTQRNGMLRINLKDNSLEIFAHPSHGARNQAGFHAVFPTSVSWNVLCNVTAPSFDGDGNLWCVFNPSHAADESQPLYCWKAADRLAGDVSEFKQVPIKGYGKHYDNFTVAAGKTPATKDFVLFANTKSYFAPLYIFHHAGTIDDTSDDTLLCFYSFVDQDRNAVSYTFFNMLYEDPATGYIWVGTDTGLFIVDPREALRQGPSATALNVRRVKLKDSSAYLLEGSSVMSVTTDSQGRKWFATNGRGAIVTTPDGSEIIDEFNTANSLLPSDGLYAVGYEPSANAIWFGGSKQTSVYYCDAKPVPGDLSKATAWPNPVRPMHQGFVTLRGLPSGTSLRIADTEGNLVKELGEATDGTAVWDLTDTRGAAVSTGLYYLTGATLDDRRLKIQVIR